MIPAKEIDGELWVKASDHHQAIKEALAQQELVVLQYPQIDIDWQREQQIKAQVSTPPQRTWVGLTDDEQQQAYEQWQSDGWNVFYNAPLKPNSRRRTHD
jgi:hypothetical protein